MPYDVVVTDGLGKQWYHFRVDTEKDATELASTYRSLGFRVNGEGPTYVVSVFDKDNAERILSLRCSDWSVAAEMQEQYMEEGFTVLIMVDGEGVRKPRPVIRREQ